MTPDSPRRRLADLEGRLAAAPLVPGPCPACGHDGGEAPRAVVVYENPLPSDPPNPGPSALVTCRRCGREPTVIRIVYTKAAPPPWSQARPRDGVEGR